MANSEWSLIIFSLLVQAGIGAFLLATLLKTKLDEYNSGLFLKVGYTAVVITGIGMLASLIHLGKPFRALNSLVNLFGSSWLSKEIFFTAAFLGLVIVSVFLERSQKGSLSVRKGINWIASITGLVAIYAMAMLYMDTIIPAWQSMNTMISFYSNALIVGAVILLFLFHIYKNTEKDNKTTTVIMLAALGAAMLELVFVPGYLAGLSGGAQAAQSSSNLLANDYIIMLALRWLLLLAGLFTLLLQRSFGRFSKINGLVYSALVLIVSGQVIGRFLFYASEVAIKVGLY